MSATTERRASLGLCCSSRTYPPGHYMYTGGNPVTMSDPSGHDWDWGGVANGLGNIWNSTGGKVVGALQGCAANLGGCVSAIGHGGAAILGGAGDALASTVGQGRDIVGCATSTDCLHQKWNEASTGVAFAVWHPDQAIANVQASLRSWSNTNEAAFDYMIDQAAKGNWDPALHFGGGLAFYELSGKAFALPTAFAEAGGQGLVTADTVINDSNLIDKASMIDKDCQSAIRDLGETTASDDIAAAVKSADAEAGPVLDVVGSTPYQVHIDPMTLQGPMAIDTTTFTWGKATLNGGVREQRQFWRQWAAKYPDTLSDRNLGFIKDRVSPEVDAKWLETFPEHAGYKELIHHHLDQGPMAIPVPDGLHRFAPGRGIWHQ